MNIAHPQMLFLLGGYDLEMLTIKQMLEGKSECVVSDQRLRWDNACLSAYQDDMLSYPDCDIFGIELQEDIPLPAHYHRIDHHNDWADKPSALEQVADILGVKLNRFQRLVAANDKGYIPAMQAIGATDEEVADIRYRDRKAQGVTEQDELLAEQSVASNISRYGTLIVVKSKTSRFSPICDRLFPYRRLLIYTDTDWMYYGEGMSELVTRYAEKINQKKMFYGGGKKGYIGCVKNAYGEEQIKQFVEQIIIEYGKI